MINLEDSSVSRIFNNVPGVPGLDDFVFVEHIEGSLIVRFKHNPAKLIDMDPQKLRRGEGYLRFYPVIDGKINRIDSYVMKREMEGNL
jgi:hypothetical protein